MGGAVGRQGGHWRRERCWDMGRMDGPAERRSGEELEGRMSGVIDREGDY